MTTFSQKMMELRRILKLHANWLLYATLGESALTTSELADLHAYGKLPMGDALDLVDRSYFVGRMRSTMKAAEFKKVESIETPTLTPVEEQALESAKHKAIMRLKNVTNVVFDVKGGSAEGWSKAVRTEFQTAKIQGIANTIANKTDLYATSDGVDSDVSVIPARQCCEDCRQHYVDVDGNPKVFKLSDLMATGSNADAGTVHTKTAGKHTHWKTTLPPLHPNCGCTLVYVPPGHGWVGGKLSVLNKSLFFEHIAKATAGVSNPGISATVAPGGAPSVKKPAGHPSVPGAAAPGNVAGPGRPSGSLPKPGSGSGGAGGGPQFAPCPFGGGADCISHGGNGATMHKPNGSIMKKHQEAMARGAEPKTPEAKEAQRKQQDAASAQYNAQPHPNDVLLDHLSEGEIGSSKRLGDEEGAGVSEAYKINIKGNGSGCMKPPMEFREEVYYGFNAADGAPSMPKNSAHKSEAGAHHLSAALGMDHVPPTVIRSHDGSGGIDHVGQMSVQHWQDGYDTLERAHPQIKNLGDLMSSVPPEHKDKMKQKMQEIGCLDFVMNNNDRHMGNLVFSNDLSDVKAIDNSLSFASGMAGHKNAMHNQLLRMGEKMKVPSHLMERFKNQSLEATMRATPGMQPWQQVQTHVRMKYLVHLQETYGHVPIEATRYAAVHAATEDLSPDKLKEIKGGLYAAPAVPGWSRDSDERMKEMNDAHDKWEMPDQMYARFAKAYASGKVGGASELEQSTLRMYRPAYPTGSGHALEQSGFTADSHHDTEHKKFWNAIPAWEGMSHWRNEGDEPAKPLRTPPSLPKSDHPSADAKTKKLPGAAVGDKTKPGKKAKPAAKKPTEFEEARTHLQLEDEPDFKFNEEPEQQLSDSDLEEVKPKPPKPPPVRKSLYLNLNAKFPLTQ